LFPFAQSDEALRESLAAMGHTHGVGGLTSPKP
jgi:hypothetical protein